MEVYMQYIKTLLSSFRDRISIHEWLQEQFVLYGYSQQDLNQGS